MKRAFMISAVAGLLGLASACTDAEMAQFSALGAEGHIICYSGGQRIYEGIASGKISTESQSDGWYFNEKEEIFPKEIKDANHLVRVSGACLILN